MNIFLKVGDDAPLWALDAVREVVEVMNRPTTESVVSPVFKTIVQPFYV